MAITVSESIILSMDDVIKSFPILINQWCLEQHKIMKKPKYEMCQIAVDQFSSVYSKDHIRKCIKPEFKVGYRSNNGKKSWLGRVKDKAGSLDDNFSSTLIEGTKSGR